LDKWRLIFTAVSLADSQVLVSPYILIIIHFDGRFRRDTQVSWFHLHFIPPRVPEGISGAGFFTGWMSYLSPNQQCQCTEGNSLYTSDREFHVTSINCIVMLPCNFAQFYCSAVSWNCSLSIAVNVLLET